MEISEVAKVYAAKRRRERKERFWVGVMFALLTIAGTVTFGLVVQRVF